MHRGAQIRRAFPVGRAHRDMILGIQRDRVRYGCPITQIAINCERRIGFEWDGNWFGGLRICRERKR
jgi:hypothetical protein